MLIGALTATYLTGLEGNADIPAQAVAAAELLAALALFLTRLLPTRPVGVPEVSGTPPGS